MKIQTASDLQSSKDFDVSDLIDDVVKFDLVGSLMSLQKLGALMANQIGVNINIEFEFYSTQKVNIRAGLLTRDFVSFVAKQVLLNSSGQDVQYNDLDLTTMVYKYGNLIDDLHGLKTETDREKFGWLWVIRATNYQWYYLRNQSSIIARYYLLLSKVVESDSGLGDRLNSALGMDLFDALKIGICIFANYCPRSDGQFATSFLMDSYTNTTVLSLRSLLTKSNIEKYLSIFSLTQDQFKEVSKKYALVDKALKKYEFNVLKRYPVIHTASANKNEQYIIPSISDFSYATFEGLYYVLLERLDTGDKELYLKQFGKAFELYIGELLKHYNIDLLSRGKIFPEQKYKVGKNEWRTVDWLLVTDDRIFQIECKKRKINNYAKAGIQSEDGVGIESMLADVAKELDKMSQKEEHLKQHLIEGVKYDGQSVTNIIVFLDEMFAINRYARKQIKDLMKKSTDNFLVFGCWEFEVLCQHTKNAQQNISYSIQDIVDGKTQIYHIDYLDREYARFFDSIRSNKV